jgi:hypothetical protein
MMSEMAHRIARRFLADQAPGARSKARKDTQPVNKPDGISREIQRENGKTDPDATPDQAPLNRKDIQPKDVFTPAPKDTGVLNLVETGKDLQRAIDDEVPENKGYDVVRNLSQYLIRTEGGGGAEPVGTD